MFDVFYWQKLSAIRLRSKLFVERWRESRDYTSRNARTPSVYKALEIAVAALGNPASSLIGKYVCVKRHVSLMPQVKALRAELRLLPRCSTGVSYRIVRTHREKPQRGSGRAVDACINRHGQQKNQGWLFAQKV